MKKIILLLVFIIIGVASASNIPTPIAQDLDQLHQQIRNITKNMQMREYFGAQDVAMNKICEKVPRDLREHGINYSLSNGHYFKNFAKVKENIFRFAIPSIEAVTLSHQSGKCEKLITLMGFCQTYKYDPTPDGKLWTPVVLSGPHYSWDERRALGDEIVLAIESMLAAGLSEHQVYSYSANYNNYGQLCVNAANNDWHETLNVDSSTNNIKEIFQALELVRVWRLQGKSICFHCHAGKHRTGLLTMLIKLLDAEKVDEEFLAEVYHNYILHTWYKKCSSKEKVKTIIPLIIQSKPFTDMKIIWP